MAVLRAPLTLNLVPVGREEDLDDVIDDCASDCVEQTLDDHEIVCGGRGNECICENDTVRDDYLDCVRDKCKPFARIFGKTQGSMDFCTSKDTPRTSLRTNSPASPTTSTCQSSSSRDDSRDGFADIIGISTATRTSGSTLSSLGDHSVGGRVSSPVSSRSTSPSPPPTTSSPTPVLDPDMSVKAGLGISITIGMLLLLGGIGFLGFQLRKRAKRDPRKSTSRWEKPELDDTHKPRVELHGGYRNTDMYPIHEMSAERPPAELSSDPPARKDIRKSDTLSLLSRPDKDVAT
ncbi:hypothetical protein F4779DRAFT_204727 [Xylariaceae sp. FL0662B]|nr:hypothetical protein F4779DRAFT_204727 [Xylariaceae sp. FL0662B]